jgi:hypothetical protein
MAMNTDRAADALIARLNKEREFCRESMHVISGQRFPSKDVMESFDASRANDESALRDAIAQMRVAISALSSIVQGDLARTVTPRSSPMNVMLRTESSFRLGASVATLVRSATTSPLPATEIRAAEPPSVALPPGGPLTNSASDTLVRSPPLPRSTTLPGPDWLEVARHVTETHDHGTMTSPVVVLSEHEARVLAAAAEPRIASGNGPPEASPPPPPLALLSRRRRCDDVADYISERGDIMRQRCLDPASPTSGISRSWDHVAVWQP